MSHASSASRPPLSLVRALVVLICSGRRHERTHCLPLVVVSLRRDLLLQLFLTMMRSSFPANMHTGPAELKSGLLPLKDGRCIGVCLVEGSMLMSSVLLFYRVVQCWRDVTTATNTVCGLRSRKGLLSLKSFVPEDMGSGNKTSVWISFPKIATDRLRILASSLDDPLDCLQLMVFAWKLTLSDPDVSLSDLAREASQRAKVASQRARSRSKQKIRQWARSALCGSAGEAHRWIKKPEQASAFDDDLILSQDNAPLVLLQAKQKEWEDFWVPPNHSKQNLVDTLERLRRKAQAPEHCLFPVTTDELVQAAKRLKPTRATGADHWSPPEFLALPRAAHEELTALMGEIETLGLFPVQAGVNIVSLIPKPTGGERPITLTPFVYFLWAALRRPLGAEWDEKAAGFWDDCIRGSNALRAGLARRLFDELAFEHNEANFSIYWDLTKFFDHVDLNRLALLADQLGFPLKVLSLALNVHCNLRLLVHKGVAGCGIAATRGILAGVPFQHLFRKSVSL